MPDDDSHHYFNQLWTFYDRYDPIPALKFQANWWKEIIQGSWKTRYCIELTSKPTPVFSEKALNFDRCKVNLSWNGTDEKAKYHIFVYCQWIHDGYSGLYDIL